ncbi:MAG: hypothetical protein F9K22_12400 [Bacteroidetes bacterium]|nr:MAG: hypothetical protein F9K22_12400 [Bacteroidota bacterium]
MASVVEVNKRSVFIRVENRLLRNMTSRTVKRGEVSTFSNNSQRRLARLLLNNAERFKYFFTLTYRKNHRDCKVSKKHINTFLTRFRKSNGSDVGYVWVLEFQKRGAVHFHIWFEEIKYDADGKWQLIHVRKQIQQRFKNDIEGLNKFKYLTYLWLSVTKQLDDEKAMKAATDLKSIYSNGFTLWYATKYLSKKEQKQYSGNVDEITGEIIDSWVGRYWGASRRIVNDTLYFSSNPVTIRIFRQWYEQYLKRKRHTGLRFMTKDNEADRISTLCDDLDRGKYPR